MGALEGPEAAPASPCPSPKLGRLSPILRALFGPKSVDHGMASDHHHASSMAQEALYASLDNDFALDAGLKGHEPETPDHAGPHPGEHNQFRDGQAAAEDSDSDSDEQSDDAVEEVTPNRPQLFPLGFLDTIGFAIWGAPTEISPTVNSQSDFLFSPSPDDTATSTSTPSTVCAEETSFVPTYAPTPTKVPTPNEPAVSKFLEETTKTLSLSTADTLAVAQLFIPERGRHFNKIVERNYNVLASRLPGINTLSGLFGEHLPWFCPVPILPLSDMTYLNFLDYSPAPKRLFSPVAIDPVYVASRPAKLNLIATRLLLETSIDDMPLSESSGDVSPEGIHVFVDMSNIIIGFYNQLKKNRGIPISQRVMAPYFFFEGLALILERGRAFAKRVVAGSTVDAHARTSWPAYMLDAELLGYEMNILNRVAKLQSPAPRRFGRAGAGNGYGYGQGQGQGHSSSYSSDEDAAAAAASYPALLRQGEQAVDEILHLKMCESILDYEKSTIVLATGDAAEAEFSAGFLAQAKRALAKGWNVELVTWKATISSSWQELAASSRWGSRFRIIPLDWYVEELVDSHWR